MSILLFKPHRKMTDEELMQRVARDSESAFEELYLIQCGLLFIKNRSQREASGIRHMPNGNAVRKIIAALPFNTRTPTGTMSM